jgi:hypothetical protein
MSERALATAQKQSTASATLSRAGILQRKCACGNHTTGGECDACQSKNRILQRKAANENAFGFVPPVVDDVLRSPGEPLDPVTRSFMGSRFGYDFSAVRVHTDPAAQRSAELINANAYTVGHDVVFGRNHSLATQHGQRLMGHELTHVIQQSRGTVGASESAAEHEADQAGAAVAFGGIPKTSLTAGIGIQRDEAPGGSFILGMVVDNIVQALPGSTTSRLVYAAVSGFVSELVDQFGRQKKLTTLASNLASFRGKDIPSLAEGYLYGLAKGVVSPVTDLFGILVFGEQMRNLGMKLASSAFSQAAALVEDFRQIGAEFDQLAQPLREFWQSLKSRPKEMVIKLLNLPETLAAGAETMARDAGHKGGAEIVASLEAPFKKADEPKEPAPSGISNMFGSIAHGAGELEDAFLKDPWLKLGSKVGYAVGWVVIQVLLIAFSGSLGNLIGEAAAGLGKLGEWLGTFGQKIVEGLKTLGTIIADVERFIDGIAAKLLKPLGPVLEPLMKPIAGVMERFKGIIRKLLGLAEKEAAPVASAAAKKGIGELGGHLGAPKAAAPHAPTGPVSVPHAHAPSPPAIAAAHALEEAPKPVSSPPKHEPAAHAAQPQVTKSHAAEPAPKSAAKATDAAGPASSQPREHPPESRPKSGSNATLAEEPVDGGHHVSVTEEGIEICSPKPCPLLEIEYAKELEAYPGFKERLDKVRAMRKSQSKDAARKAAELQKELQRLREASARVGTPAELELDGNTFELDASEARKRDLRSGKKSFSLEHPVSFDIDEPLPVGGKDRLGKDLSVQERMKRALDPHNRQLLDPQTNRRSKHIRETVGDPGTAAAKPKTASVVNNPESLFTHRFDEVSEMKQIFDEAVGRVKNPGSMRPTALKNTINENIRDIIQNGRSPSGIAVRDALKSMGFEYVAGRGIVAVKAVP